jgi:uncharacterized protein
VPGMIGGALGAYILTSIPGDTIKPYINAYLLCLGLMILWRATRTRTEPTHLRTRFIAPLGFSGGFFDAIGGGGWGATVTSTLLCAGIEARRAIGTVNAAEFFVTATISAAFVLTIGLSHWWIVAGLVCGGVLAAPLAALAAKHFPDRIIMAIVGGVVVLLSVRGLLKNLG